MLEPTTLRYFREVAELGSVRQAAERLFVAQSAISRQIALLEEELGAPLFERRARGMAITAAGERLLAYAHDMRGRLDALRANINEHETLLKGHVRIACVEGLLNSLMPALLSEFRAEHPHITLMVEAMGSQAVAEAVADQRHDLGLIFGDSPRSDLVELVRIDQPLCAVMPIDHPLSRLRACSITDVIPYPVVLPDRSFGIRQLVDRAAARARGQLQMAVETNSLAFAGRMVVESGLITFQPRGVIAASGISTRVVVVPLTDPVLKSARGTLVASYARGRSPAAERLSKRLMERMVGKARKLA